jgi:hypothetical protein
MSIDFFNNPCKEDPRTDNQFGICDDQNHTKAYTDITDPSKWVAKVLNQNSKSITFTAIDICLNILKENSQEQESSCDGMLTYTEGIIFVELKDQGKGWIPKAKDQLENTIKLFQINHPNDNHKFKKAYVCNKKHPFFQKIDNEENLRFFRQYSFRLDIQREIVIK